jgi:hypothetical protein
MKHALEEDKLAFECDDEYLERAVKAEQRVRSMESARLERRGALEERAARELSWFFGACGGTETTGRNIRLGVSKRSEARASLRASVRGLDADVRGLRGVVSGLHASIPQESRDLRRSRDARG